MTRYIENLNECTDPQSGDWLWVVDVSAGSTDKDRKLSVGRLAQVAKRNQFSIAQGLYASKSAVASGIATNIAKITIDGAAGLGIAILLALEVTGTGLESSGLWLVTNGYNNPLVTEIGKTVYGHTVLTMTAAMNTGTRELTLTVTQTNGSAIACTVQISALPIIASSDGALTITAL